VSAPTPQEINEWIVTASPAGFGFVATQDTMDPYIPAAFHRIMSEAFVDVTNGRLDVLILQVPVQHGKSTTISQLGIAHFLGTHPNKHVVGVSYNTEFAADNIGAKARTLLERYGKQYFGVSVDPRSSARNRWNVVPGGGGLSTFGIDKGVAGRRADVLLIDDPYPGLTEAMSKPFRDKAWNRYLFELVTRKAPGAGEIHVMSRWGDDDHVARLIKLCEETGLRYRVIDFPARAVCSVCEAGGRLEYGVDGVNACGHGVRDALGRLPGEALWEEVRGREFLLQQRRSMGSRAFDALFQGRPRPDGGLMFGREWFQCRKFQFVDPAASKDPSAARFRDGTFLMTPALELIAIDMVGGTIGAPAAKKLVKQQFALHRPQVIGVEENGMGLTFVQDLIADSLPIRGILADKDKVIRAMVATVLYENLRVYHLAERQGDHLIPPPWVREMEEELLGFPAGAYKDMVDVISMAAIAVSQAGANPGAQGYRIG
jgi:predicted phage terminase large subunit-like protein